MFLKKIEMRGFKSFANHEVIIFESSVTGVVGPNGCGKSNISDAIRWVLGEQSVKSMRGDSMLDVIFNGSEDRRRVNLAEVTLSFDNSKKILNTEFEEVEVTRRLYRDTNESQYLINKTQCRLRDIHDLVMDTGLGRDSLSIISQGSISHFAEAKPEERRLVFEEAAGVAKYKQRKLESLRKLDRTKDNIERTQDIVDEIDSRVKQLKKSAEKAEKYEGLKKELQSLEVSVLVKTIQEKESEIKKLEDKMTLLRADLAALQAREGFISNKLKQNREELFHLDLEINKQQEELINLVQEISTLEVRQAEFEEKRKHTLALGNPKEIALELQNQKFEVEQDYNNRKKRYEELSADYEFHQKEANKFIHKLGRIEYEIRKTSEELNAIYKKEASVQHRLERPYERQRGIQSVMEHKNNLKGVHSPVSELIQVKDGYEQAIHTALGSAMYYIVTENKSSAVHSINFLKKNKSGRASFLPMEDLKPRKIHDDALLVCQHDTGYLGLASEFVMMEKCYRRVQENLLGNIIITKDVDSASRLSRKLNNRYKIVSLEGDVVHPGGLMTGGHRFRSNHSILLLQKEKAEIDKKIFNLEKSLKELKEERTIIEAKQEKYRESILSLRLRLAQSLPTIEARSKELEKIEKDLNDLNIDFKNIDSNHHLELSTRINELSLKKEELTSAIAFNRDKRHQLSKKINKDENNLHSERREIDSLSQGVQKADLKRVKYDTELKNAFDRLSVEYQMTYEYALDNIFIEDKSSSDAEVQRLRDTIRGLGNINLDAPNEYRENKERFDFLSHQLDDLLKSREKLLSVISEMDEIMIFKFKDMFDRVNSELDEVFQALFGGGHAKLILVDPSDLLNTGVDIDVQPPGKSVQNIRLFSGGEKSLIAISVLFSIIKARHVPLCVFDEVEAALDQANVERFANYVNSLSDDTQFIIITHRPGTMERCDVLYGVTMPEKGVSKMLKVQLDQAIELKED